MIPTLLESGILAFLFFFFEGDEFRLPKLESMISKNFKIYTKVR